MANLRRRTFAQKLRVAALCAGAVVLLQREAHAAKQPAPRAGVSPEAKRLLRQMSDYLAGLKRFSVASESVTEVVAENGERLQFPAQSQLTLERPNRLRSERKEKDRETTFIYDGKQISLYTSKANVYATVNAPQNMDAAIDFARDRLGLDAPAADLLMSNPYDALMEDVTEGRDLGVEMINDVRCHHLVFRNPRVDWQIWIAADAQPLPYRLSIVSKTVAGAPEFVVQLSHWELAPTLAASTFQFTVPPGAAKIDFYGNRPQKQQRARR